jgi:hypothetical protein
MKQFILGTVFVVLTCLASCKGAEISEENAIKAIIGESANQWSNNPKDNGMLAVAGALRNRGTLHGVYGFNNPIVNKSSKLVFKHAREAWLQSKTNDITRGASFWGNKSDLIKNHKLYSKLIFTVKIKDQYFFKVK